MSTPAQFLDIENGKPVSVSHENPMPSRVENISTKFREAFESYEPGVKWNESKGSGDLVILDGNTAGASYLVISKDPLTPNTVTTLETIVTFDFPVELSVGLHRSQASLGQEFSTELVDTGTPIAVPADLAISSIQQATTTLTVVTATPHGMFPGKRFEVVGVTADSRLNYPALVVAAVVSPTSFTATAGPMGTIPSVTSGPFAMGTISQRSAIGQASNGTSMIFESASATNATFYVRSESGDAMPSGTIAGNHSVTIGSTASIAAVAGAYAYAWQPTTEYRLSAMLDRIQWSDVGVDGVGQSNSRFPRSQIVPSGEKRYKLRFRATNNEALTVPVGKIVSVTKSGSTTWTVITELPHGLTTGDFINTYGNRDTVNFPNLTTATAVSAVVDANTFQVVSTTGTATGYGGTVYRVNGNNLPSALGAISQVVQSISRTANLVTAIGSATWAGVAVGDYINLHGVRESVAGSDVGLDGPYRVQSLATTTMVLEPIGDAPTGADVGSVNTGGTVIRRTDLRISYARVFDFERLRVEALARPSGDAASAIPVVLQGGTTTVTTGSGGIPVTGPAAHDAVISGAPVRIGARAASANYTAVASGDVADLITTLAGSLIQKPYAIPEQGWSASLALTTATAVPIQISAGPGLKRHITAGQVINTGASTVDLIILDNVTERWRLPLPPNVPVPIVFPTELPVSTNIALNANLSAVGTVRFNAQGYTSP
jgi:hypothetical protein